ncbi:unnamed protein product [Prunus armeniaca]
MVWRLLTVYARTDERVHHRQWHTLNERILRYNEPCIVVGDFNDILDSSEKAGGNPRDERSMAAFREFVSDFMLMDLGFDGYPFTWRNRRESGLIQERLDRGLTLEKWLELYPEARVTHQILSVGQGGAVQGISRGALAKMGSRVNGGPNIWQVGVGTTRDYTMEEE